MIHDSAFIANTATVVGDVHIGEGASVWFGAVVRGDVGAIEIGKGSNVQDGSVLHVPWGGSIAIGEDVTVGHRAVVHGCAIGNRVLVGMGAIIMDGARIGDDSIVGAAALVTEGMEIPPRSLVLGIPAKVKRQLTDEEVYGLAEHAREYARLAEEYRKNNVCHPERSP